MQETEKSKEAEKPNKRKTPIKVDFTDPMVLLEAEGYARHGYDDEQIAEMMGVVPETFCRHKKKKVVDDEGNKKESQLSQALRNGRKPLSVLVENALYKRAMGGFKTKTIITKYEVIESVNGGQPINVKVVQETEIEHPPSEKALQLWLQSHVPDIYAPPTQSKIDLTNDGKAFDTTPLITKIEHVTINSDQVKKVEADT